MGLSLRGAFDLWACAAHSFMVTPLQWSLFLVTLLRLFACLQQLCCFYVARRVTLCMGAVPVVSQDLELLEACGW